MVAEVDAAVTAVDAAGVAADMAAKVAVDAASMAVNAAANVAVETGAAAMIHHRLRTFRRGIEALCPASVLSSLPVGHRRFHRRDRRETAPISIHRRRHRRLRRETASILIHRLRRHLPPPEPLADGQLVLAERRPTPWKIRNSADLSFSG